MPYEDEASNRCAVATVGECSLGRFLHGTLRHIQLVSLVPNSVSMMKANLLARIAVLLMATLSARAEPPDEFAGEWPKGIAGAWCLESKSKVGDGIEMLFTHGDCSKTPERSLQVKADVYRIAYDTCTIGKVMLWLGAGPRDEPDDYHKRYQMIASCETKVDACTVKVNFYVRNDAKLGMWFLPADVRCEKKRLSEKCGRY